MYYKIYVEGEKGWEQLSTKNNFDMLLEELDELVYLYDHILVIEHNINDNSDFPLFSYYGDLDSYLEKRKQSKEKSVKLCF